MPGKHARPVSPAEVLKRSLTRSAVFGVAMVAGLSALGAAQSVGRSGLFDQVVTARPEDGSSPVDPRMARIERLHQRHDCSTTGLAPGVTPVRAVIRDPQGRIRLTSFDDGWAVHLGHSPGTLISVCAR